MRCIFWVLCRPKICMCPCRRQTCSCSRRAMKGGPTSCSRPWPAGCPWCPRTSVAIAKWCAMRNSVRSCPSGMQRRWRRRSPMRWRGHGTGGISSPMPAIMNGRTGWPSCAMSSSVFIVGGSSVRDLYTRFVSGVFFTLHERLKGHDTTRVRRGLEETQWWPRERLDALRLERLRGLLGHAYRYVPYYKDVLDRAGLVGGAVTSLDDLQRLPLLTKSRIRTHSERLTSTQARQLARFNTGGSSGEPLVFWLGKERVSHDVAAMWRATRWWDVDIGDPEVVVWGSPIELGAQDRLRRVRDALFRTSLLPAFDMSVHRLDEYVDRLRAVRPRMIFGYPSSIAVIVEHARRGGKRLDDLGTKVVFVTSERLYDHQRSAIESGFACPVANGYGGRDAGFIAHQCPAGGMHITAEDIIVEIIDAAGRPAPPGLEGEVVITHLATRDFPFIRYCTGDVAVLDDQSCFCGRGLPLLKEIQGRTTDFVVAADGTLMHGLSLIYVIRDVIGVENFKIEQLSLQETVVKLVVNEQFKDESMNLIERGLKKRLGANVNIKLERVAEIPREASGKYRYVKSCVATELNRKDAAHA